MSNKKLTIYFCDLNIVPQVAETVEFQLDANFLDEMRKFYRTHGNHMLILWYAKLRDPAPMRSAEHSVVKLALDMLSVFDIGSCSIRWKSATSRKAMVFVDLNFDDPAAFDTYFDHLNALMARLGISEQEVQYEPIKANIREKQLTLAAPQKPAQPTKYYAVALHVNDIDTHVVVRHNPDQQTFREGAPRPHRYYNCMVPVVFTPELTMQANSNVLDGASVDVVRSALVRGGFVKEQAALSTVRFRKFSSFEEEENYYDDAVKDSAKIEGLLQVNIASSELNDANKRLYYYAKIDDMASPLNTVEKVNPRMKISNVALKALHKYDN